MVKLQSTARRRRPWCCCGPAPAQAQGRRSTRYRRWTVDGSRMDGHGAVSRRTGGPAGCWTERDDREGRGEFPVSFLKGERAPLGGLDRPADADLVPASPMLHSFQKKGGTSHAVFFPIYTRPWCAAFAPTWPPVSFTVH